MPSTSTGIQRLKLIATCVSVVLNAICANGVLVFPLMAPALATRMKFTQQQLTSIVLAGMVGQYPISPIIGKMVDHYGPGFCSLIAAVLFSSAFGLTAWEFASTPDDLLIASTSSFRVLVASFGVIGIATGFSYFAALFAATKNFPEYIGISTGIASVSFAMCPLFLSIIASKNFTSPETGLQVPQYLVFLALLCGSVNLLGVFTLQTPKLHAIDVITVEQDVEPVSEPDEQTNLLVGVVKDTAYLHVVPVEEPAEGSIIDLIRDPLFPILFVSLSCLLGSCEMVLSNIGTITLSLPSSPSFPSFGSVVMGDPDDVIAPQVRLLSISNAICRLVVGLLADYLSPVACYIPDGSFGFTKKRYASRVLLISASALLLAFSFTWMEVAVRSQSAIWVFSVCVGIVHGGVFNTIPALLSSIWGLGNLGRNFGIIAYSPLIGTTIFSFIYSFESDSHSNGGICEGVACWRTTFWVNTGASILALVLSLILWRQWRDRV